MEGTLLKQRYLIQQLLGEGGMGRVYNAIDTHTREPVAVKILFGNIQEDPALARSLMHEARAVARLHHRNIVRLVDFGHDADGSPFLVMEYVPGKGLDAWLGYLSIRDLRDLFDQILASLGYAHARGVIHRDLKPENILVVEDEDGQLHAKLVDFGIAQVEDLEAMAEGSENTERAVSKRILGTPSYMAPEQARGRVRELGPETDLYALGIILYLFVTGTLPFVRDTFMAVILAQVNEPVPSIRPAPGVRVPPGLEALIYRLLEKEPRSRPMFAADVRRTLRKLDWDQASEVPPLALTTAELESVTGEPDPFEGTGAYHQIDDDSDLLKTLLVDGNPFAEDPASTIDAGMFAVRDVPFVGRDQLRDTLWSELEDVLAEGSVRVAVLSGPVGVGKSRVARWLSERAVEEGLMQSVLCGVGAGSALPLGGLRTLIERYTRVNGLEREACRELLAKRLVQGRVIEQAELEPLFEYLRPSNTGNVLVSDSAIEPVGVAARILRFATERRPVLLWIDDLQGPDASILVDLIDFLVASRAFSPMPIFPVITVPEAALQDPSPALEQLWRLGKDEESVVWHSVEPMSHEDLITLAQSMVPLTEETAERVALECRGRPQLLSQILAHWIEQGQLVPREQDGRLHTLDRSGSSVSNLQELWKTRLGQLLVSSEMPTETLAVVKYAAVCGRQFDVDELGAILQADAPELLSKLDVIWSNVIGQELWTDIDEVTARFATPELHEHALHTIASRAEEVRLNAVVGQVKESMYRDEIATHHPEIADHYEKAGLYDRASQHYLAAAQQAQVFARYADAIRWLQRIKSVLEEHTVTDAPARADEADLGLALSYFRLGGFDSAEKHLHAIEQRARPGRRDRTHARLVLLRAELARKRGQLDDAISTYEKAEKLFQKIPDGRGVALALQGLADVFILRVRYADARKAAVTAHQLHLANDAPLDAGRCLLLQGKVAALENSFERAEELYDKATAVFEEIGARHAAADAGLAMVHVLGQTGRLKDAVTRLGQLLKQYIDVGDQASIALCHRGLGQMNLRLGHLDAAESSARASLEVAQRIGDQLTVARAYNGLGEVARKRENWEDAREQYSAYLDVARGLGDTLSVVIGIANLGLINGQLGEWEQAAENFEEAVTLVRRAGNRPFLGAFLGCLAHTRAEVGIHNGADKALDEALEIDAELQITESDFLNALEGYASAVVERDAERSRKALEVARDRWKQLGRTEAVERVEKALDALD